ncbi:MAG: lipoprotein [Candidatus Spyradocola sp.]
MKRILVLLLAVAMLTGCSAPAADSPAAESPAASPTAAVSMAAIPAEASAPDPWAVWDGERLFYVGNDGLHRREGEQDSVVDAGESRQYRGLYPLADGRLLVLKRLAREAEDAQVAALPSWAFGYEAESAIYDVLLLDEQGENPQTLLSGGIDPIFVREDALVCVGATAERALQIVDLTTGETRTAQGVDLSNQVVTEAFAVEGTYYFSAMPAEQDDETATDYALDPESGTVRVLTEGEMPDPAAAQTVSPSALPEAQVERSGSLEEQTYLYHAGEETYSALLRMDMDLGAAVVTFLVGEEPVSLLEVESIYSFFDYDEVQAAGEEAFILAKQAEDGVYYAAYVEQLRLSFAGGWAFVYEGNAAGVGGPERLVLATPFSVGE